MSGFSRRFADAVDVAAAVTAVRNDLSSSAPTNGVDMVGGLARIVLHHTGLRALLKTGTPYAYALGRAAPGDGAPGWFYYDAADVVSADDDVRVIVATDGGRWKAASSASIDVTNRNYRTGDGALAAATTAVDCFAAGRSALAANTSGFGNSAGGVHALKANTSAAYSTAFGAYAAENADLPGNVNLCITALGAYALNKNIGGQYNVGLGHKAGELLTTGYFNTLTGTLAMPKNVAGFSNTVTGHAGFFDLVAGNYNVGVGDNVGLSATNVSYCTLGGFQAGANNLTGNSLTAWGYAAASSSTAGNIAAFGREAAYSVAGNGGIAAFGNLAGQLQLGSNWTALGHEAFGGPFHTGGGTAAGYRAGYANAANFDNIIALGSNSTNTRSNQAVIGDAALTEVRSAGAFIGKAYATGSTPLDSDGEVALYRIDDTHIGIKYRTGGVTRTASITVA